MVTVNKFLAQPLRGSEVGVWDVPVNNNMGIVDNSFGGTATIAVLNAPVVLSSAQYQCAFLRFTGAITTNIAVTLPAVGSFYTVINDTTNSSAFILTMTTTAAGGRVIGVPPGTVTDIMTDATNVRLRGLPHVGSYWDYAGSSIPAWVSAHTVPPWVYCNGGSISSASYPALTAVLGGTTLPDLRGRGRFNYNDGTGRITTTGGVDGNTLYSAGGTQTVTISSANLPNYNMAGAVTDPGHIHPYDGFNTQGGSAGPDTGYGRGSLTRNSCSATTGISVSVPLGGGGQGLAVLPPMAIGGITMIRAA